MRLAPNESLKELEGSPINCAPEMIKATGYNYPRDWWSVGIIIYHMIGTFFILGPETKIKVGPIRTFFQLVMFHSLVMIKWMFSSKF